MGVTVKPSQLKQSKWQDYAVRFVFGGLVTAITGYITTTFGPVVGGLFLAFPAILPASLTLVKEHSGETAAGDDALGAIAGSMGLLAFGGVVWGVSTQLAAWLVLLFAAAAWLAVATALWHVAKRHV